MRVYSFLILIFLAYQAIGQEDFYPPVLNIEGVNINWIYLINDTNFVYNADSKFITSYSSHSPTSSHLSNDENIFLFNQSYNDHFDPDGFDLYVLDCKSGELVNSLSNDFYTGAEKYQYYRAQTEDAFDLDLISIIGYESIDSIIPPSTENLPVLFFNGNISINYIDKNGLEITEVKVGNNENIDPQVQHNFISFFHGDILMNSNRSLIHMEKRGVIENGFAKNVAYFYSVDEDLTIDSSSVNKIYFDTNIPTNSLQLTSPILHLNPNDSLLVLLNYVKSVPQVNESPSVVNLNIYSYKDYDNIVLENAVDLTFLFPKQENPFTELFFDVIDDYIILSQSLPLQDDNQLQHSWLAVYNLKGELIKEVDQFYNNELNYRKPVGLFLIDDDLFFSVNFSNSDSAGFHIFKLSLSDDTSPVKVSSLSYLANNDFDLRSIDKAIFDEVNNQCIFPIRGTYKVLANDDRTATMTYYLSIDLDDEFISTTHSNFDDLYSIQFYPNPTYDKLNIMFNETQTGVIQVFNGQGKLVVSKEISNITNLELDVSKLLEGLHFIKFKNDNLSNSNFSSLFYKG